ncbi:MAG TPA: ABC transporter permease subunit [Streptosporangiaceae bacterium]|nr:ABC transporter permease subunit [Streptosporangiaceae bacterium]
MTAGSITAYRSAQRTADDGFRHLLHAEWTKFRTVRGWLVAVVAAMVLIDVVGLLLVHDGTRSSGQPRSVPAGPGGEAVVDSFTLVGQPAAAYGSLTVRVTSLTGRHGTVSSPSLVRGVVPWAKAGIIITQSTRQGAAYAALMVTGGHGVRMQANYNSDVAGMPGAASPRWLRLTRSGDMVTGYDSAGGSHWAEVGTVHLTGLPPVAQAGLFVTSPMTFTPNFPSFAATGGSSVPSVATGVFDHVTLSGAQPGGHWAGQVVGADGPTIGTIGQHGLGFRAAGGRFTVTGSGDIAPVVAGGTNSTYLTGTIGDRLAGLIFGMLVLMVVGVLFITAEYRRGLIRTTLTASPRRGRALAAKVLVAGLAAFVLGLPATALAVVAGAQLSRNGGQYVLPVGWPTELRVIAGSAALLGVATVLAVAVGTILRRGVLAVVTVFAVVLLPYVLGYTSVLPPSGARWFFQVTPAAAFAIQQSVPQYPQVSAAQYGPPDYFPLSPWAGFAVLCAYTAAALALAFFLLRRRDA